MPQQLPMLDSPRQTFSAVLDGQSVVATVRWNETAEGWFLDLAWPDTRGAIVTGRAINHGRRVLGGTRKVTGFEGDLVAIGPDGTFDWWGAGSGELYYLSESEIDEYDALAQGTVTPRIPTLGGSIFERFQFGGAFVLRFHT